MALVTPVGFLSYPHFFKARPRVQGNPENVFSGVLLFTEQQLKTDAWKALEKSVYDLAGKAFPQAKLGKQIRSPFRDPSEKENFPSGMSMFLSAWSHEKPGVIDAAKNDILDSGDVWPGQLARFSVAPFSYDNAGNKGVSFYLHNVQIVKSAGMKRLDGRKSAQETFDDEYADEEV